MPGETKFAWLVRWHGIMHLIVRPRRRFSRCLGTFLPKKLRPSPQLRRPFVIAFDPRLRFEEGRSGDQQVRTLGIVELGAALGGCAFQRTEVAQTA